MPRLQHMVADLELAEAPQVEVQDSLLQGLMVLPLPPVP
jgi:hypothetical protein